MTKVRRSKEKEGVSSAEACNMNNCFRRRRKSYYKADNPGGKTVEKEKQKKRGTVLYALSYTLVLYK